MLEQRGFFRYQKVVQLVVHHIELNRAILYLFLTLFYNFRVKENPLKC